MNSSVEQAIRQKLAEVIEHRERMERAERQAFAESEKAAAAVARAKKIEQELRHALEEAGCDPVVQAAA